MKKRIFTIIAFFLLVSSCKDYLKEEFVSGIGYPYYETESGLEDLVRSAYVPLRSWGGQPQGYKMTNNGTDIWEFTNVSDGNEFHMYTSGLNPANANFYTVWTDFYKGISCCNIAINRIPGIKGTKVLMTDTGKKQRLSEAKFLRAYYYFELVQIFGKVPLLLQENIGSLTEMKRAPVADIYNAIISDLRFAADNLSATPNPIVCPTPVGKSLPYQRKRSDRTTRTKSHRHG
jgi:hypothetical protein